MAIFALQQKNIVLKQIHIIFFDMKHLQLTILALCCTAITYAQYNFSFTHYSSDNGLSQNSITALHKDRKGYVWIGTRDGLNKFDGYNFRIYNSQSNELSRLLNNRILNIGEDKWGFIWIRTYDEIIYRLNTTTEEFQRIEGPDKNFIKHKIESFKILETGDVWLITNGHGLYKVTTNPADFGLRTEYYNTANEKLTDNRITDLFEDTEENLWILSKAGLVMLDKQGKMQSFYNSDPFYSYYENERRILFGSSNKIFIYSKRNNNFRVVNTLNTTRINQIVAYASDNYVFTLENNGFGTLDINNESVKLYNKASYGAMPDNNLLSVYVDKAGLVWLGLKQAGVLLFNPRNEQLSYIRSDINEGQIINPNYLIFEDERDVLWIQPYYGSFSRFDRLTSTLVPFHSAYNDEINKFISYGVNHIWSDKQGVLWLSTNRGNGIFKCTFLPEYFTHHLIKNTSVYSISNETRALFEDKSNRLWVSTKDGMLHIYDQNKKRIGAIANDGRIAENGKMEFFVYNIFQDKKGDIWLATKRQGIYRLKEKQKNSFTIENFRHNASDPYSPYNNDFYYITQDKNNRLWAGSYGGGLHLIDESTGRVRFLHYGNELKNYPMSYCLRVRQIMVDTDNIVWVATTEGFVRFDANFKNIGDINFYHYQNNHQISHGMGANDIYSIYEDNDRNIWFATFGGGFSRLKNRDLKSGTPSFEVFDRNNGMPNNVVYTIVDDKLGNLWLTTDNSIVRFNKEQRTVETFGKGNELENVEFSEAHASMLANGEIVMGAKSGFYSFLPTAVRRRMINAPLVFTRLLLFNREVKLNDTDKLLSRHIDFSDKIVFSHKQNVFSIEFATLDMRAPEKIQYAYMLEGFDKDWNIVQSKHYATYTALPPGNYVFRVKSTDSEGFWLDNERLLNIKIRPSFWQSGFARFMYVLLSIALLVLAFYIFYTIVKLKSNVSMEKQMTDMKLRFFTDISHELRTPLSLISLPVDNLLQENFDPAVKDQLLHVRRNLDRVLGLINQILDFRKLQNNKMRLTIEELKFAEFVKSSVSNFNEIAHSKKIDYEFVDETNGASIWVDPERFDSIIYNLLSNAFKFTPDGKKVVVKCVAQADKLLLVVADEGVGIAREKINFIFDRFFSVPTLRNIAQKSTGIGLDLVKKLVDLHKAEIRVESQVGVGTTFEIEFRAGLDHFTNDADVVVADVAVDEERAQEPQPIQLDDEHKSNNVPLILIVEDNDELRSFLRNSLKNNYRVEEAENGEQGWNKIEFLMPDFIITDLRMPVMDGLQMLEKIKNDKRTSHIPVIMLTAVTDMQNKLAGIRRGADDYITKPFSAAFLHARIDNLMAQRKQLQQYYRTQIQSNAVEIALPPLEIHSSEELFMKNLMKLMHENIDNFDLNIDYLASELGMSRTVFFNKLKSLTGLSPVEFVREVRFERAAEYIRNSDYTVSEISYLVGIEDPRYFSRCFKQKFGKTPSDYRTQYTKPKE